MPIFPIRLFKASLLSSTLHDDHRGMLHPYQNDAAQEKYQTLPALMACYCSSHLPVGSGHEYETSMSDDMGQLVDMLIRGGG